MVENTVDAPERTPQEIAKDIAAKVDDLNEELRNAARRGLVVSGKVVEMVGDAYGSFLVDQVRVKVSRLL